jgi:hypothetical protein
LQEYRIEAETIPSIINQDSYIIQINDPLLIEDLVVGARVTTAVEGEYFSAGTYVTAISGSDITISIATLAAVPANTTVIFYGVEKLEIILFNDSTIALGYGYMQFKDMLNRVHYKRIRKSKSTKLAVNLRQKDTEIYVEDGSVLSIPNPSRNLPGVIEINGERIEYFGIDGNVLTQLRRGTLGTGCPAIHRTKSYVIDIGPSETIPYNDQHIIETFVGDGSNKEFLLNYTPKKDDTSHWFTNFGYTFKGEYNSLTSYIPKNVVSFNYMYYKNILPCKGIDPTNPVYWEVYISIPSTHGQSNELDIFVGGYRLKKVPYYLFEESNNYPYSPEGDSQKEAEFSVNGENRVRLTTGAPENSKVVVIKKVGRIWEDAANPERIFRNIRANIGDATFDITKVNTQYNIKLINAGTVYDKGQVITIAGSTVGGVSPDNDIQLTVTKNLVTRGTNVAPTRRIYPGDVLSSAGFFVVGETYVIEFVGSTDFTAIGASVNTVGTEFTATGIGSGNGTAFRLIASVNPNEQVFTLSAGFPTTIWYNSWFTGNGGEGYITAIDSGLGQTFTVTLERPLDNKSSIAGGDWTIRRNRYPLKSIVEFSYTGVGRNEGFVAKSLVESNNSIADFLKNTETVFPSYISTEEDTPDLTFDNPLFTMDDPEDTFDQG